MHGRHYAGETARRLIKHATLSDLTRAARLSARLFETRAAEGAFVNVGSASACRISAFVLGLQLLSPAGAGAGQLRTGLNLTNVDFTHAQSGSCEVARKGGRRRRRLLMLALHP